MKKKNGKIIYELHPIIKKYFNDPVFKTLSRKINACVCELDYFMYFPVLYENYIHIKTKTESSDDNVDDIRLLYYPIYLCCVGDFKNLQKKCIVVQRDVSDLEKERIILSSLFKLIFLTIQKSVDYYEIGETIRHLINNITSNELRKELFGTDKKVNQKLFGEFIGLSRANLTKGRIKD